MTVEERFWSKVLKGNKSKCWYWIAAVSDDGYGRFWIDGKCYHAHQVPFVFDGTFVPRVHYHHICKVKSCVNPEHVTPMTSAEHRRAHTADLEACPKGHPWTRETIYWKWRKNCKYPTKECRVCRRIRQGSNPYPERKWTPEKVILALRECAQEDSRTPRAIDFNPATARKRGKEREAIRHRERGWPPYSVMTYMFGSWRQAILAAGLEARAVGKKTRQDVMAVHQSNDMTTQISP